MSGIRFEDDITLRDMYAEHTEVLQKIKRYITVPCTKLMTLNQVAEFYEIPFHTTNNCYRNHIYEVDLSGVVIISPKSYKEILLDQMSSFDDYDQLNGRLIVHADNDTDIVIPNRGIKMFPERAVLRIGMLLTQSEVARQVRQQLLNIAFSV